MDTFRFADNLDGEAVVALGLPVSRLVLAGLGSACAWAVADLPLPAPLRLGGAGLLALTTAILAWGKVQGVSVARWAWLFLGFSSRLATSTGEFHHRWVDADPGPREPPGTWSPDEDAALVAFLSLRPGVGCTTVFQAVKNQLRANGQEIGGGSQAGSDGLLWAVANRHGSNRPALLLLDWGTGPQNRPLGSRLAALILVLDGNESHHGELTDKVAMLRRHFSGVEVLVALNRAQSSSGLRAQIAGAGARLAGAIPVDRRLGDWNPASMTATAPPAADAVRMLAREVLAASRSG
ncbi:MAG TPA: hypothetical protein VMW80_06450 [Candidatus Dormibacteraeota bacterium]|nr:hypothetical protein [Candidatus Dormibacteraeota bacterium]